MAEIDGEIVGMARVVGDGAMFFYLQDVVVAPPHQRKGVGAGLIRAIRDWLIANVPPMAQAGVRRRLAALVVAVPFPTKCANPAR